MGSFGLKYTADWLRGDGYSWWGNMSNNPDNVLDLRADRRLHLHLWGLCNECDGQFTDLVHLTSHDWWSTIRSDWRHGVSGVRSAHNQLAAINARQLVGGWLRRCSESRWWNLFRNG